jgi:hypothetical protein
MRIVVRVTILGAAMAALAMVAATAFADPYPDQYIKFLQRPMVELNLGGSANPQLYYGHDEKSTAYYDGSSTEPRFAGTFMADDFADLSNDPVAHVQWWGSYIDPVAGTNQQVKRFLIAFEKDVPAGPTGGFSHPGEVLSSQIVTLSTNPTIPPPAGMFTERQIRGPDPLLRESLYRYNAELTLPFPEKANEVYWLKIVALVDPRNPQEQGIVWGWHNRNYVINDPLASIPPLVNPGEHVAGTIPDATGKPVPVWHFQDDAVTGDVIVSFRLVTGPDGTLIEEMVVDQPNASFSPTHYMPPYDGPSLIGEFSKDLAFALYSVPEPTTMLLLAIGLGCLVGWRRAKRD